MDRSRAVDRLFLLMALAVILTLAFRVADLGDQMVRLQRQLGETANRTVQVAEVAVAGAASVAQDGAGEEYELSAAMGALANRVANLWFAGHSGNKALISYEVHEIREAFAKLEAAAPMEGSVVVADEVQETLIARLPALEEAASAGNTEAFESAYSKVLSDCNSCHNQTGHPFIKIVVPRHPPQSNRSFGSAD